MVRRGETGLTGNIYTGLHEFRDMAFVLHFLRKGDLFFDVGANSGSYTILACAAVGARGVAFEPVPSAYRRLLGNVRINNMTTRVECVEKCVGAKTGVVEFTADRDTTNQVLTEGDVSMNTITVHQTTLDAETTRGIPTLMKIDVEGYEAEVLAGAENLLQRPELKAAIVEMNPDDAYGSDSENHVVKIMRSHGFSVFSYNPWHRRLEQLRNTVDFSGNALFIRDVDYVERRLESADAYHVHGLLL